MFFVKNQHVSARLLNGKGQPYDMNKWKGALSLEELFSFMDEHVFTHLPRDLNSIPLFTSYKVVDEDGNIFYRAHPYYMNGCPAQYWGYFK